MNFDFVMDVYTERRGAPAMLELYCAECRHPLMTYQKDGPGPLKRCYLDRIHGPAELRNKACQIDRLQCEHCHAFIGKQGIYEKEQRLAFILVPESVEIAELK